MEGSATKDIVWFGPDGQEMTDQEWQDGNARCLGAYLAGDALAETDARGRPISDRSFVLLFNAYHDSIAFRLPALVTASWHVVIDTTREDASSPDTAVVSEQAYPLQGRSLVLLAAGNK